MSANIVAFPARPRVDIENANYFGDCPDCGKTSDCLNVGRNHYFVCHEHRTRWWAGSNLFSSWRHESEELHRANAQTLSAYRNVEPLCMTREELTALDIVHKWRIGLRDQELQQAVGVSPEEYNSAAEMAWEVIRRQEEAD